MQFYKYLFIGVIATFSISCNHSDSEKQGKKVFRYNQQSPISSLDPAFARSQANIWAIQHLYNTLITLDDSLIVRPDLANRWEVSPDGLHYTFYLKPNVYFHDNSCFPNGNDRTRCCI
jgi:peptide/nickel transport system substrate-binding protein